MGKVYRFLGLSVGLIVHDMSSAERQQAYAADVTYGTNNEMGFDYLRDNMAIYKSQMVQRGHAFAIVDEVDSILIDEARTPLIISGQGDESTDLYRQAEDFAARLTCKSYASIDDKEEEDEDLDADYVVDEKARTATLTARGIAKAETAFGLENLADIENATLVHHIDQAIRAHGIMKRDIDYVVKDGEVIIVDEDGVHLVHDGEGVAPLHHLGGVDGHVVPQVVEAELVVGTVGDVGGVGRAALVAREVMDDQAHAQAEEAVHLAHPLAVALGKIVVHGDDVDAVAVQGV